MQQGLKAINTSINDKELTDQETLLALVLCECRILLSNAEMCKWVEEEFRGEFQQSHQLLCKRVPHQNVREAVVDVLSMLDFEAKKV